jgi:hypothetical protein
MEFESRILRFVQALAQMQLAPLLLAFNAVNGRHDLEKKTTPEFKNCQMLVKRSSFPLSLSIFHCK